MEDPQGRSGLPTGVYGMLTSDHDTEKTSGEKYQRASQGGVGVVNVQMNEFSEGHFYVPFGEFVHLHMHIFGSQHFITPSSHSFTLKKKKR